MKLPPGSTHLRCQVLLLFGRHRTVFMNIKTFNENNEKVHTVSSLLNKP